MVTTNFKSKPARSKRYREWVSRQSCCLTGERATDYMGVDPHHENRPGESGMSTKPCDSRCVPVRHDLHVLMESPGHSRREVWEKYRKDPEAIIEQIQARFIKDGGKKFW